MLSLNLPMSEYMEPVNIPDDEPSAGTEGLVYEDWSPLVEKIQAGDPEGMAELYRVFSQGIRFYLCRQRSSGTGRQGSRYISDRCAGHPTR